jgi:Damage-control phosphatase ARMT1-like domain
LFFDLAMADFLLQVGWVGQITFHLKPRPFFVADAMLADLQVSMDWLAQSPYPAAQALGLRLADDLAQGRLKAAAEPFWSTCLMLRRLPQPLLDELCQPDLVIFKGDVNYRRILDDRHWPFTTPMAQAAAYLPFSFASLRTLKGEMVVGLQPEQVAALSSEDPAWLINGKRGVIHFIEKR